MASGPWWLVFGAVAVGACGTQSLTGGTGGGGATPGTGGIAGGSGGGPSAGAGGSTSFRSDGGDICSSLQFQYNAALLDAQNCDLGADSQCQQQVPSQLTICSGACPTYVTDAAPLNAILQRWIDTGCAAQTLCPPVVECVAPPNNACLSIGGRSLCSYPGLDVCTDLAAQYVAAMPAAQSCQVGAQYPCTQPVVDRLTPCSNACTVYVTDATALSAIQQRWTQAGCANLPEACLLFACVTPVGATCEPADGGDGVCSTNYSLLPN